MVSRQMEIGESLSVNLVRLFICWISYQPLKCTLFYLFNFYLTYLLAVIV